jgi:hypothetical protein
MVEQWFPKNIPVLPLKKSLGKRFVTAPHGQELVISTFLYLLPISYFIIKLSAHCQNNDALSIFNDNTCLCHSLNLPLANFFD